MPDINASAAGTVSVGGEFEVNRLGFGAMRITGEGVWGPPQDHDGALAVLRRAVELGINFIDTADSYGPDVSEELIAEALHPYSDGVLIATKGGLERTGPGEWPRNGRPQHLREACEGSLRRLGVERIGLYQLHAPDPEVPYEDSVGTLVELRKEGKINHIGISNVSVDQLRQAEQLTPVASVQNRYNLGDRGSQDVLDACTEDGRPFIPWFPLTLGDKEDAARRVAERHGVDPPQVALAWLLQRSRVMLPIAGTANVAHLEANVAAASLELDDEALAELG